MMNFNSLREAKKYVREMSVEDTEEIGNCSVVEYSNGAIEILTDREDRSDMSDDCKDLGTVTQVLCG